LRAFAQKYPPIEHAAVDQTAAVSPRRAIQPTRANWFAATPKNRSILGLNQER
jgi:hypothetical protein